MQFEETGVMRRVAIGFVSQLARSAGCRQLVLAFLLVPAGFVAEGVGLLLLVPILSIAFGGDDVGRSADVFDDLLRNLQSPADRLQVLLVIFFAAVLARAVILSARDRVLAHIQAQFVERLRSEIFDEVAAAPWHRLMRMRHGRIMTLLSSDIHACGTAAHHAIQSVVAVFLIFGYIGLTFLVSPTLSAISAAVLVGVSLGLGPIVRHALATGGRMSRANLAMADALGQLLGGLKTAKSLGGVDRIRGRLAADQYDLSAAQIAFLVRQSRARIGLTTAVALVAAVLVYLGSMVLRLTAAQIVTHLLVLSRLAGPVLQVQQGVYALTSSLPAFKRLQDLREEIRTAQGGAEHAVFERQLIPTGKPIIVDSLSYCAPGENSSEPNAVLHKVSFVLEPTMWLGISGPSGCGKSTLADLLAGLLIPDHGEIRIGDKVLEPQLLRAWRRQIGYAPQDSFLLNESVRANLTWGTVGILEDELWDAMELVGISGKVNAAGGLDVVVGERGAFLSGGERQRMALARALLRRPSLLILDEATNALDTRSENVILERIAALDPRPSGLIISHSPAVLDFCDAVLLLTPSVRERASSSWPRD